MKTKLYESLDGDLYLLTLISKTKDDLLGILDIESEKFEKLLNCSKNERIRTINLILLSNSLQYGNKENYIL